MKKRSGNALLSIVLVDAHFTIESELRALGCKVLALRPGGGFFALRDLLGEEWLRPDLFVQMERLDARSYFEGLENLPCPTFFWAIDSHLNMFWQKWYTKLFDAVLTPHVSLFSTLPDFFRPIALHSFTWPGLRRDFVPHADRKRALGLCARIDAHRPLRASLLALLKDRGLEHNGNPELKQADIFTFYADTKVVPNESLTFEVNYRLLEAASCGCMVLSPDAGEDQNTLLEPGREFLVYHDGLELLDFVDFARRRPLVAEKIGLTAARRVTAEHLPPQRAHKLLEIALNTPRARLSGPAARMALWLCLAMQIRNHALPFSAAEHADKGMSFLWGPERNRSEAVRPLLAH
ncbi:MAG: glycosyltransferase, partial [Desulfovibrio sp.]|nr:glycosyltransferase [Desulfovibrio sp.]